MFVLDDVLSLFYCLISFIAAYVALLSRHWVHSQLKAIVPLSCHANALGDITQLDKKIRAIETGMTLI